ncbi:formate/nitrite transporter family protein [Treponema pedis]|uniref:formate/nitrite transporter family protein n=1 Tax=Treponema pedis TaxID=409322 RepID=UPI0003F870A6|nr:formate/nitrite transporter family protein [Treponema pedis]
MSEKLYCDPAEILEVTVQKGIAKVNTPIWKQFILGILAGVFIAFASEGSNMAAFGFFAKPETYGLGKFIAGLIFPVGLMLVVIAGGELFTGNNLIMAAVLDKKVKISAMFKNWITVYAGNFIGSILIAFLIVKSGQLHSGNNLLGGITVKIAYGKISLSFIQALFLGIMCNWLVCLAVWLCYGAKDMTGKFLAVFFPIWLFITSGFEHSIANMYYIPAGILAKTIPEYANSSKIPLNALENLNWTDFFTKNLIPVTLGNIIGGAFFVACIYWLCYRKRNNN